MNEGPEKCQVTGALAVSQPTGSCTQHLPTTSSTGPRTMCCEKETSKGVCCCVFGEKQTPFLPGVKEELKEALQTSCFHISGMFLSLRLVLKGCPGEGTMQASIGR